MNQHKLNPSNDQHMVSHRGIVKEVQPRQVVVSVVSKSACAHCQLNGSCSMADMKEKLVEVPANGETYREGESVEVFFHESLGFRALFLGYILPFIILLAVLITVLQITHDEGLAGLAGLASLIPYYTGLYLKKNQIKKQFHFQIQKQPVTAHMQTATLNR